MTFPLTLIANKSLHICQPELSSPYHVMRKLHSLINVNTNHAALLEAISSHLCRQQNCYCVRQTSDLSFQKAPQERYFMDCGHRRPDTFRENSVSKKYEAWSLV